MVRDWPSVYLEQDTGDALKIAGSSKVNVKPQEDHWHVTLSLLRLVKDFVLSRIINTSFD